MAKKSDSVGSKIALPDGRKLSVKGRVPLKEIELARFRGLTLMHFFGKPLLEAPIYNVPGLGTAAIDRKFRIYMDLPWFKSLPVVEQATTLLHEIMHPILNHAGRASAFRGSDIVTQFLAKGGTEEQLLQIENNAGDAAINGNLLPLVESRTGAPVTGYWFQAKEFGEVDGKSFEQYMSSIIKLILENEEKKGKGPGGPGPGDPGQGLGPGPGKQQYDHGSGATGGAPREYEMEGDVDGEGNPAPGLSELEIEAIRVTAAHDIANAAKDQGNVPAGLQQWAEGFLKPPKVDWEAQFRNVLTSKLGIALGETDEDYTPPDRRYFALGDDAPIMPAPIGREVNVGLVIDTSGSMGGIAKNSELAKAVSEAWGIIARAGLKPWVTCVDEDATEPRQVGSLKQLREILLGGGGTNMVVGVRTIASVRPVPAVIVLFTDGYTDWPDASDIPGRTKFIVGITPGGQAPAAAQLPPGSAVILMQKEVRDE